MIWPQETEKALGEVLLVPNPEFQTDLLFLALCLSLHLHSESSVLSFFYNLYSLVVILAGSREEFK